MTSIAKEIRSSYLEREAIFSTQSPLRGFFTLFWIVMAYYLLSTSILYFREVGLPIGLITFNLLSEDMKSLFFSDFIMILISMHCFIFQKLIAKDWFKIKWKRILVQFILEFSFIMGCFYWCFTRKWYFVQRGVFILHSIVMSMKVHSYNSMNNQYHELLNSYYILKKGNDKFISKELNKIKKEISFNNNKNHYPQNLTVSNFLDYYLIPSLVYKLEYPRTKEIRYWYVIEKLIASIGTVGLIYISVEHYLIPLFDNNTNISLFELWIRLTLPFTIIHLLIFYVIFECICNGFAEITRYADRNFYDDWWNSSSFSDYSNKWNKPVHLFLKHHIYKEFRQLGLNSSKSVFLTFLISSILHELAMVATFSHFSFTFFIMQMAQIPIIYLMRLKVVASRPWLGNALFWLGLSVGIPMISIIYGKVERPLLPIEIGLWTPTFLKGF